MVTYTIAIIAAVTAIAVPNFMSYPPKMRLNGATRVVASDLMAARMEAVKMNQRVYLAYTGNQQYHIAYLGTVLKTSDLMTEYSDVQFSSDFGKIYFNGRGASTGSSTVQLANASGNKNVTVNLAGRVNIE